MKRASLFFTGLFLAGWTIQAQGVTLAYEATGSIYSRAISATPHLYAVGDPVFIRFSYDTTSWAPRLTNGDDPPLLSVLIGGIIGLGGTPVAQFSSFPLWEGTGGMGTYSGNAFGGEILTLEGVPTGGSFGFDLMLNFLPGLIIPTSDALFDGQFITSAGSFDHIVGPGVDHGYSFVLTSVRPIPEPSVLAVVLAVTGSLVLRRRGRGIGLDSTEGKP